MHLVELDATSLARNRGFPWTTTYEILNSQVPLEILYHATNSVFPG